METDNTDQEQPELQDEMPEEDMAVTRTREERSIMQFIELDPRRRPPPRSEQRPQ